MGFVDIENVTKRFGATIAVDNVSVSVPKGKFLTLLGPSGCGKTTLLRMIAGFLVPDEGSILIDGQLMNMKKPYQRNVGLVFQNYALFQHMSVFKNIAFGLEMRKLSAQAIKERVHKVLELMHLEGLENRYPKQLSGGQQQRIALARTLVTDPNVLLLDEPLSNLDLKLRHQMRLEIKRIQYQLGVTTIYVTHDQGEALSMSDMVAVMSKGKVMQLGEPADIYDSPSNEFVADFVGEADIIKGTVNRRLDEGYEIEVENAFKIVIPHESLHGDLRQVVLGIRPERNKIINLDEANKSERTYHLGTVEGVSYAGSTTRYVVRVGEIQLRVDEQASRKRYKVGDKVGLILDSREIRVLSGS
jgi:putative spermidine/putrescine transport system ATP-binding protein/spermidine/putrescine transport system ATP-binding protein